MSRLPSFTLLRAFEAAARLGSFTRAAQALFVTQGAISQNIKQLEQELGVSLFRRAGRGRILTEAGQALSRDLGRALQLIGDSIERLRADQAGGTLTISTLPSFAMQWLIPRLGGFRTLCPEIDVRVHADERAVDLAREGMDMAIRYGPPPDPRPDLQFTPLLEDDIFPACSPDFLRRHPGVRDPRDLRGLPLIHDESDRSGHVCAYDWAAWLRRAGVDGVAVDRGPSYYQGHMVIRAAIAGQGVALVRRSLVEDELARGQLVRLFDVEFRSGWIHYIVEPASRVDQPKLARMRGWLLREAAGDSTPQ